MVNKISEKRKEKGYNQKKLANELGISVSYLSKLEGGKRKITMKMAARIADKLDCSLKDLFF